MAAAVTAHDAGVVVIVIERGPRPFERQLGTPTRMIYPISTTGRTVNARATLVVEESRDVT